MPLGSGKSRQGGIIVKMMHPDIFKEFGINVKRCYKFRGMYICETDKGKKIISISDYTPVQITLEHNIKKHLIEKGFNCVNQLKLSSKNTPYVIYYNNVYIMTDWNDGQQADFYNIDDIKKSVKLLAKMHIAGNGFTNLLGDTNSVRIKNLGETYEKRYRETIKLKRKIESVGSKTEFEVLYLKNSSLYEEYQQIAREFTNKEDYKKLVDIAGQSKNIAHHKYTYHNIITLGIDNTIITGFEKSGYDVQITDLAYIARRIMQRNGWDINLLLSIIEEYNKFIQISNDELGVLKGMIIFPERFAKLCNQYYHSKRRWNYNMYHRKLTKILDYKDNYAECVQQVMKW